MFKKVLLVNDSSKEINRSFEEALKSVNPNVSIHVSHNGKEAFDYIKKLRHHRSDWKEQKPDAIFLDLDMPVMDGYDFLVQYNQVFANKDTWIPIWILSEDNGAMANSLKTVYTSVKGSLNINDLETSIKDAFANER
jgi:CheY-like chemotaxis protein